MLYALLDAERGMFIRGDHGDVVGAHVFQPDHKVQFDLTSPTAHKMVRHAFPISFTMLIADPQLFVLVLVETKSSVREQGFLHGVPIKGYGASDAGVVGLIVYTEQVLAAIPIPGPVPSES
jgi:hypothetical protein